MALCLTSCATPVDSLDIEEIAKPIVTKYKVGDCAYLIDPENGKGKKKNALRIEEVLDTDYIYRWWIPVLNSNPPKDEWAIGVNTATHEYIERMTKRLEKCPG